ncbi:hypothetical protein, partial [Paenibacillus odorifer]|uniref:hypothetical protein n=1 Tax=Paenibacillus odorifer TaxID=189426 RepID=UPI0015C33230
NKHLIDTLNENNLSLHDKIEKMESKQLTPEEVSPDDVQAMLKMLQIVTKEIQTKEMPTG